LIPAILELSFPALKSHPIVAGVADTIVFGGLITFCLITAILWSMFLSALFRRHD
jgi:hypothetical protein